MPEHGCCECGCGQPTKLASKTNTAAGHVKGEPHRYVVGHGTRQRGPSSDYDEQDRGYETPCHIWSGYVDPRTGYAVTGAGGGSRLAHRRIYEDAHGTLPPWPQSDVDHLCRVRDCVRLDHLEAVTHAENIRRGARTKLTLAEVDEIRTLCAQGWVKQDIANAYDIGRSQVTRIAQGQSWVREGGLVHAAA